MQTQNQKKVSALTAILMFALVAIIGVGATLAYLTDTANTDTIAYTINPDSKLEIELDEPIWNQGNKAQPGFFDLFGRAIFSPERKLIKDPQITVTEGSVNCYVRLQVRIDRQLATLIQCPPEPYDDWYVDTENYRVTPDYYEYYYYYTKEMKAEETTTRAFAYIEFKSPRKDGVDPDAVFADSAEEAAEGKYGNREIVVKGEAIQADPFESWDAVGDVWNNTNDTWYYPGK